MFPSSILVFVAFPKWIKPFSSVYFPPKNLLIYWIFVSFKHVDEFVCFFGSVFDLFPSFIIYNIWYIWDVSSAFVSKPLFFSFHIMYNTDIQSLISY